MFLALAILTTGLFFISKSSSAQTINTGDATSETVVENVVNTNIIKCKTCISPTPTQEVTPTPTPTPTQEVTPTPTPTQPVKTPTPTSPPSQGGGGGEQPSGGGVGGPSAPSAPQPQGEVLGLSITSGEGNMLFQIGKLLPSLFLSLISLSFLKRNEKTKTASKKRK